MRRHLLSLFICIFTVFTAFAQNGGKTVTGKLQDSQTKEALVGVTVTVKGTSKGTVSSLDGTFKINLSANDSPTLVISYIGYITKEVQVTGNDLGTIALDVNAASMKEVTITGDIAIDRKTPVAVTTINARTIEEKIGPEDLTATFRDVPGVMATNTTGFGDARVSIRGFKSTSRNGNVAMTINGIPVNDMENGTTYWSDFTGLNDVTTSVQIQRGLGASKIIVPSFGGTINITTRNTDAVKGGYVSEGIGSDGLSKQAVLVSTGLNQNGWAATFSGSRISGNYYADNLQYTGYNYFFNLSKVISPTQTLSFSVMGASQKHNTRYYTPLEVLRDAPQGVRYNPDAGVLNGKDYDPYQNYFAKPVASLNHSWIINDKSSLTTVLYGTYGTGGGVSLVGGAPRIGGAPTGSNYLPNGLYDYSPYDLTAVVKTNSASVDGSVTQYVRNSVNNHDWVGLRSTFNTQINNINLSAGIDLKDYRGAHFEQVNNLLGGQYVLNTAYTTDPTAKSYTGDKVGFYNVDNIISGGAYAQAEYTKNDLSAFATLSGTESSNQRNDYYTYKDGDPLQHSPWVNFFTYQAKGGANYNINDNMNLFANVGYITKPPYFDAIFINFTDLVNKNTVTEKLFSYELGYGYKTSNFKVNLNFYRSAYMDRAFTQTLTSSTTGQQAYVNITGVNEMHQGGELEIKYQPINKVTLKGSLSIGDWYYTKNAGPATAFDENHNLIGTSKPIDLKGLKVGDAPQTQAYFGVDLDVLADLRIGADYYYTANYTADYNFFLVNQPDLHPWKVPNYNLFNLNAVFKFKFAGLDASLIGNVNNVLNTKYISDALDGASASATSGAAPNGNPANVTGYYGYGRIFATTLKIKF